MPDTFTKFHGITSLPLNILQIFQYHDPLYIKFKVFFRYLYYIVLERLHNTGTSQYFSCPSPHVRKVSQLHCISTIESISHTGPHMTEILEVHVRKYLTSESTFRTAATATINGAPRLSRRTLLLSSAAMASSNDPGNRLTVPLSNSATSSSEPIFQR